MSDKPDPSPDTERLKIEQLLSEYMQGYWQASANDSGSQLQSNDRIHADKFERFIAAEIRRSNETLLNRLKKEAYGILPEGYDDEIYVIDVEDLERELAALRKDKHGQ
jgi:hypothetical protein